MTLDSHLPRYDFNEVHSIGVTASPEETLAAARAVTPREVPLTVALMAVRSLPALLTGQRHGLGLGRPLLEQFERAGFVELADWPEELVIGGVGRFWRPDGAVHRLAPGEFETFEEPGFVKAAFNFRAAPQPGGGCRLTTETRIAATDAGARREFGRYWRVIRPGSGLIRREWLRAIRRRAQR